MKLSKNNVDVCYKDVCVKANGKNADLISIVLAFTIICIGLSALQKAFK